MIVEDILVIVAATVVIVILLLFYVSPTYDPATTSRTHDCPTDAVVAATDVMVTHAAVFDCATDANV